MTATSDRVDVRLDADVKRMWERAAELSGVSLSAFIKMATSQYAERLINTHDTLTLDGAESAWFIEYLRQPAAAPTPAMERAAALRRELLGN